MTKQEISDLIYNTLDYAYCDTCRHDGDDDRCDYCHRKSINWEISRQTADRIAEKIAG